MKVLTYKRAKTADTAFLGWVIAICSVLFVFSFYAISNDTTHVATHQETTTTR
jgi:hypothetical protein